MFGGSRRHRPPPPPLTRETANPNAATAAASAFMRREPSTSLSSAAAAAALKARPTTPTNVAQVQSKRALRRSVSVSSTGSRERGRHELHRTPSNGSMTERTFRSPSPARSAVPNSHDVPPLPTMPQHRHTKSEAANSTHKRATSLQTQSFRTGSQKIREGHGSWFGAATAGDLSNVRHSDDVINNPDLRPVSPTSSINFSYPRSKLEGSGSVAGSESGANDHAMVYDANSRRMVPRGELLMREQSIRDASEKPVKKKKQGVSRSGSHLTKGNVSRTKGTALESPPSETSQTSQVSSLASVPAKPRRVQEELKPVPEAEPPHLSREQTLVEEKRADAGPKPAAISTQKPHDIATVAPPVAKKEVPVEKAPEPVQEPSQPEDEEDMPIPENYRTTSPSHGTLAAVDALPVKSSSPVHTEPEQKPVQHEPQTVQQKAPVAVEPEAIENRQQETVRKNRVHSESPHRTTHFAPTPDSLHVRHEPPPRSLSPRKSALKQSSPRDVSPSENGSERSSVGMAHLTHEDSAGGRKKNVRVSFDDQNTSVIGASSTPPEPDSPIIASPQNKKPWHNIMGRYKRDATPISEDETMTPRPALPSFGSVREKKIRETEERPLVRPAERSRSPQMTPTPPRNISPEATAADVGQSSDQAIGTILSQEQYARHEANISKYREPLPPVVTSVESSGYISNSSTSSDDEMEEASEGSNLQPLLSELPATIEHVPANGSSTERKDSADIGSNTGEQNYPTISIIQPSPRPQDDTQPDSPQDFFDVPGGFPDTTTDTSDDSKPPSIQGEIIEKPVNKLEQEQPVQKAVSHRPAPITPQRSPDSRITSPPSPLIHNIREETEESDHNSIYSDAYEDLSDIEGDGFMSLDAVVDSPVNTKLSSQMFEKAIAKSKKNDAPKDNTLTEAEFREPLKTQDDWENAKAYWRSLSSDKRRQLEREALEEAGEEGDLDEVPPKESLKAKKRRSLDAKSAKPLLAPKPQDPSRIYQIQPGTAWGEAVAPSSTTKTTKATGSSKMKKSMREGPASKSKVEAEPSVSMRKSMRSGAAPISSSNDGHLRKSLRAEPEAATSSGMGMRKSLRGNGAVDDGLRERGSLKKSVRPVSYQPAPSAQAAQSHRRNQSANPRTTQATKPVLARRGSDSSESSFKRARSDKGEGLGFRRTMRSSVQEPDPIVADAGKASSRFSLRSLSPTGSAFRRNSGASPPPSMGMMGGRMRQSLRPQSSDGASRMSTSSFGRPASKGGKKAKKGSRFADSSDEDDARPAFSSRFAESSDEDDFHTPRSKQKGLPKSLRNTGSSLASATPTPRAPVQARDDEELSDLPDSDDEIVQPKRGATANGASGFKHGTTLKRSGSGRESLGAKQSQATTPAEGARPAQTRRGSFMSILRRKKDPAGKISRDIKESGARKDTRLERSADQLAVIRSNSGSNNNNNNNNARLQKRAPSWPLAEEEEEDDHDEPQTFHDARVDEEKRPSTANGPPTSASASKPVYLKRRSISHGAATGLELDEPATPEAAQQQQQQKKKKFGTLRKMFGLHD